MLLRQVFDEALAQYAYIVGCQRSGEALVIDPERDVDRYLAVAAGEGLTLTAVAETHIHADFLSGARELAEKGAQVFVSDEGDQEWKYAWVRDARYRSRLLRHGDTFHIGEVEIRAVHTPGHTPEHLSFLITDRGAGADEPMGIATGDFVFVGDVGRPDLLEVAAGVTGAMRPAAERLGSALREFAKLPDALQIWPGHGAGSACGKALGAVPISTVGYERCFNRALRLAIDAPAAFVEEILEGQPEPPLYFAAMKQANKLGPPVLGALPCPRRLSPDELASLAERDSVVVLDLRSSRAAFMQAHLKGSLYAPLDRRFAAAVGSYAAATDDMCLVADTGAIDAAVKQLVRIGYDNIRGFSTPADLDDVIDTHPDRTAAIRVIGFSDLERVRELHDAVVLDVRSAIEYAEGHLDGAINVPHTRLLTRLDELPHGRPLAVHCASGARAAGAAAALARSGFEVYLVDARFPEAESAVRRGSASGHR
jgi:hydroxyacylglutathione hydrolase